MVVAPPAEQPPLDAHPFALWHQLHPESTAADRERLQRLAREHDLPQGAYSGGFGLYWLGRAIEATLSKTDQPPTLRYVRGVLRSWRVRTTDVVSAYGSDAPTYGQHHQRAQPAAGAIPAAGEPAPAADLRVLWQRILVPFQERLDRATFATWLQDSALVALDAVTAVVAVPHVFAQEHIMDVYGHDLAAALSDALRRPVAVEVVIGGDWMG